MNCGGQTKADERMTKHFAVSPSLGLVSAPGLRAWVSFLPSECCLLRSCAVFCVALLALCPELAWAGPSTAEHFRAGGEAYRNADYAQAAKLFGESVAQQPSSGALQNLGNAEWQRGRAGAAVLAWEQALWLSPGDANARENLRYARETQQLEAPELTWYEAASAWLPVNWWPWITAFSLWTVAAMLTLPLVCRWRRSGWQQAVAALALGVFILCLPAHWGVHTRSQLGFVLQREVPLRLTPTREAEEVTRLAAGEPARLLRSRGDYVFLRTSRASGWVEKEQFGLVCPR
jgi:tetratricopeptide (TPR) repeat protein